MDLFIQTLTGTLFELRVSPFETILSIKGKIQRLEGIPISQQHLIWKSVDLQDDGCLHDYGIQNGATITLVLAMRDGPINMTRVSIEEPELEEIEDYMEANRDEIWDKLLSDGKQVTLLVFRDGEQLNFFRVYDRGNGSLTPSSDSLSTPSLYNQQINEDSVQNAVNKQNENALTKDRIAALKERMAARYEKKGKNPRPPSTGRPSSKSSSERRVSLIRTGSGKIRKTVRSQSDSIPCEDRERQSSTTQQKKHNNKDLLMRHPQSYVPHPPSSVPPVKNRVTSSRGVAPSSMSTTTTCSGNRNSIVTPCAGVITENEQSQAGNQPSVGGRSSAYSSCKHRKKLPGGLQDISERVSRIKSREKAGVGGGGGRESCSGVHTSGRTRRHVLKPLNNSSNSGNGQTGSIESNTTADKQLEDSINTSLRKFGSVTKENCVLPDILNTSSSDLRSYKSLLNWARPKSSSRDETVDLPISEARKKTPELKLTSKSRTVSMSTNEKSNHLLPVHNEKRFPPTLNGKKKIRCVICTKKLGLATTYQCRCGGKFCAAHRYPETHVCSYDYKTEGRKFLQKNNPVVTAPKLPKI